MRLIKTTALAGLYATIGSAAIAADITQAMLPSAPVTWGRRESSLGWYLRGEIGYVDYKRPDADFTTRSLTSSPTRESMSHAVVLGAGLGYRFNPVVRADVTLGHTFQARFKGVAPAPTLATATVTGEGSFQTSTLMLNGYLDFRPIMGLTPYVGAGIGIAHNILSDHTLTTYDRATGIETVERLAGGDDFDLAWALMAGVGYRLSSNFSLDLGYRYVSLGGVRTRSYGNGDGLGADSIGAHEVRLGVRYSFR
ncbi:outer membrane protein [Microvirga makkahensis]|uniref:Outer membrane beta-barrel protein n=1 Tax=Microvirga makkahensis TaxID=1128670 RepID=A0A7X3MUG4_9HYPH|nr:outer membrane protein [Microvirga makkahensis]MXQ13466.1 outer membrane beta-barrel protein [Microvirga makkahensis]